MFYYKDANFICTGGDDEHTGFGETMEDAYQDYESKAEDPERANDLVWFEAKFIEVKIETKIVKQETIKKVMR